MVFGGATAPTNLARNCREYYLVDVASFETNPSETNIKRSLMVVSTNFKLKGGMTKLGCGTHESPQKREGCSLHIPSSCVLSVGNTYASIISNNDAVTLPRVSGGETVGSV